MYSIPPQGWAAWWGRSSAPIYGEILYAGPQPAGGGVHQVVMMMVMMMVMTMMTMMMMMVMMVISFPPGTCSHCR